MVGRPLAVWMGHPLDADPSLGLAVAGQVSEKAERVIEPDGTALHC